MLKNVEALRLIFIAIVVLIPVWCWCFTRRRTMLRRLAEHTLLLRINDSVSFGRQIFKAFLLLFAFLAIVIALARPAWNPRPKEIKRKGRDLVILLDTSRSMLAEDLRPNRLERAKLAIRDLMETLQGDRIAIITFAGNSTVKCPLTQDYGFVRMILDEVTTESTTRGGTNVGDAIRDAIGLLTDGVTEDVEDVTKYKDIILITDGDDQEDSAPIEAAAKAGQVGIRILAIGLGDSDQGARIPIFDTQGRKSYLTYNGQEVWSKLQSNMLRNIAMSTPKGAYADVGTQPLDLADVYERYVMTEEKMAIDSGITMQYDERFQVFLALAILLLISEGFVSERKKH